MDSLMSKIFGDSWRSTVISILTGLAAFLSFYPDALAPLPDYWENLVRNFLIFLMSAGIISKGFVSRDSAASKKTTERLEGEIRAATQVNVTDAEAKAENSKIDGEIVKKLE